jgi:hypothetical protein
MEPLFVFETRWVDEEIEGRCSCRACQQKLRWPQLEIALEHSATQSEGPKSPAARPSANAKSFVSRRRSLAQSGSRQTTALPTLHLH